MNYSEPVFVSSQEGAPCLAAGGDCLPPEACVWSQGAGGPVQLRDVRVGDKLLAVDAATRALSYVDALGVSTRAAEASWVRVRAAGVETMVTATHPMRPELLV